MLWSKLYVKPQFVVRMFSLTNYTEWNPFWEASSRSASQNSPPSGNQNFTIAFSELPLVSVFRQMTPAYILIFCFSKIHFNIIRLSASEVVSSDISCTVCHGRKETGTKNIVWEIWCSCSCFDECLSLLGSDTVCHSENGCPLFQRNFVLPSSGSTSLIRS